MIKRGLDIRKEIFRGHLRRSATGVITAEAPGVLSGIQGARDLAESLGLTFLSGLKAGTRISRGQELARITGNPFQIARAEEQVIGLLSKPSGIATAARKAAEKAGGRCEIVSGGWKKMPYRIKDLIREAARDGGIKVRISDEPFVYLDKNYVRILGGVGQAVEAASSLNRRIVVQIRGETNSVENEAIEAVHAGADVVMVDTGKWENLRRAAKALKEKGLRSRVRIAFAGNISLDEIGNLAQMDLDILDIGYAILDAPCLPMRFDVIAVV